MEYNEQTGEYDVDPLYDEQADELREGLKMARAVIKEDAASEDRKAYKEFEKNVWLDTLKQNNIQPDTVITPEQQDDLTADYHQNLSDIYRKNQPKTQEGQPQVGQSTSVAQQPSGDYLTNKARSNLQKRGVTSERITKLKTEGQKRQLTDDELVDVLDSVLA